MSNLDNYHPFRSSVNLNDNNQNTGQTNSSSQSDNQNEDFERYKPLIPWKLKLLFLVTSFGIGLIIYIFSNFYSFLNPLLKPFGKHDLTNETEAIENSNMTTSNLFDSFNGGKEERDVSKAKKNAGFLSSIFCKGGKKSSFCD